MAAILSQPQCIKPLECFPGYTFPAMKESDAMFAAEKAPEWKDGECCHRCRVQFTVVQRKVSEVYGLVQGGILTLMVLKLFLGNMKIYGYFLYFFVITGSAFQELLKFFHVEDKNPCILHFQYHGC